MRIGFDLDKVLIDYPPLIPSALIDRLYKEKGDGALLYRIPSRPEQFIRLLTHYSLFRQPIVENIKFIKSLPRGNKNKYFLISSRFGFLKNRTEEIVKKHQFDKVFYGMFFNFGNQQPHLFKDEVVKKLKLNRYVDDDLSLLKFLSQNNPKIKFFWLNKRINQPLEKNLRAITHLFKILK